MRPPDFSKQPTIGVLLGDVNTYSDLIWAGITTRAMEEGVNTISFLGRGLTHDPVDRHTNNIIYQLAYSQKIAGLIILTAGIGSQFSTDELAKFCHQFSAVPVISVGAKVAGLSNLLVDNQTGLRDLLRHIIRDHDRREIAFIRGPQQNTEAQERYLAYQETLAEEGLTFNSQRVIQGEFTYAAGYAAVETLLANKVTFDALAAIDDESAWGAMDALIAHGKHIPQDVAVTGFDDIVNSQFSTPPLSTVRQPRFELGQQAFDLLWNHLQSGESMADIVLPTEMVLRESCGCLSPAIASLQSKSVAKIEKLDPQLAKGYLIENRERIAEEIDHALDRHSLADHWLREGSQQLLFAIFTDLIEAKPGTFLRNLDQLTFQAITLDKNLEQLQVMLSILRENVLAYIRCGELLSQIETLIQQGRITLGNAAQQAQMRNRFQTDQRTSLLFEINEDVITSFDLSKLMMALPEALQQLGNSFCFLCLNDDLVGLSGLDEPPPHSNLIFAYLDEKKIELEPGGLRFETIEILPDGILSSAPRMDMLAVPLHFQQYYLGYAIFEMGPNDSFIYDGLQIQISNAVQGASLIHQLNLSREELERRVEERTVELQKEIAERIRIEENLRENEQRYRALFEQTTDAVFIVSLEGLHLAVNQRAADMLGYTLDEMIGMPASQIIAPDEFGNAMAKLAAVWRGESVPIYERNLLHKDGSIIPVEIDITLVSDDAGKPVHIQSVIRDITKRKRTERVWQTLNMAILAMQNAFTPEEIFKAVGTELKNLGFECTIFRTRDDLSEMFPRYFSYSNQAIAAGVKLLKIKPEDFVIKIEGVEIFEKTIWDQETVFVSEAREATRQLLPKKLKKFTSQLVSLMQVPRSINAPLIIDDQVMGMLSVQSNDLSEEDLPTITVFAHQVAAAWQKARLMQDLESALAEQLRVEESLRESEGKYRTLFELSPEAIVLIGLNGIILDANEAAAKLGGIKKEEVIGKSFLDIDIFEENQTEHYLALFSKSISGDLEDPLELQISVTGNEKHWIEVHPALVKKGSEILALQLIIRDVTERKIAEQAIQQELLERLQAEMALQESEERFRSIFENAVMGLYRTTPSGKITMANPALIRMLGFSSFEELHNHYLETDGFPEDHLRTEYKKLIEQEGQVIGLESAWERRDGSILYVRENAKAIYDSSLAIIYYEGTVEDITQRKQIETLQRLSEERFNQAFNISPLAMGIQGIEGEKRGVWLLVNDAFSRTTGYDRIEVIDHTNQELQLYALPEQREQAVKLFFEQGFISEFEFIYRTKSGDLCNGLLWSQNIQVGGERNILVIIQDITERTQIEKERQALINFQQIVAGLSTRFINLETVEIELEILRALRIIADYAGADAASVWMFDFEHATASKTFGWPSNEKSEGNQSIPMSRFPWMFGKLLNNETVAISSRGEVLPEAEDMLFLLKVNNMVAILAIPLVSEGNVLGSLSIYMREVERNWGSDLASLLKIIGDIIVNALERKRAEENIRQLNEELETRVVQRTQQLEAANKELEAFAYSVSHDLRAPLRALDGFSLALIEDYGDQLDENAENYLHRVRAASQRMGQLIDDLLKLSRVTRSEMLYQRVDLSKLVLEIIRELQEAEPNRMVEFDIQPDQFVFGDDHLLRIVLANLLRNAWKFTSKTAHAQICFGSIDEDKYPVFFVRDNGAGFDMAYADKLFGTFQRLHSSQDFEGTGIGLATVKRILLRHGGRVWAEGHIDQGATFYFTIG